jgi:hypothetical protein
MCLINDRDDDKGVAIMSRHRYPTEICRVFERSTAEKLQKALTSLKELENSNPVKVDADGGDSNVSDKPMKEKQGKNKGGKSSVPSKNTNEGNRVKQATLKTVLGEVLGYGPALSEHIILDAGLVPNTKFSNENKLDDETIQVLVKAVAKFENWLQDIISGDKVPEGYILMQNKNLGKDCPPSDSGSSVQVILLLV